MNQKLLTAFFALTSLSSHTALATNTGNERDIGDAGLKDMIVVDVPASTVGILVEVVESFDHNCPGEIDLQIETQEEQGTKLNQVNIGEVQSNNQVFVKPQVDKAAELIEHLSRTGSDSFRAEIHKMRLDKWGQAVCLSHGRGSGQIFLRTHGKGKLTVKVPKGAGFKLKSATALRASK